MSTKAVAVRRPSKRAIYALNRAYRLGTTEGGTLTWDEIGVILAYREVCPLLSGTAVMKIHDEAIQKMFMGIKAALSSRGDAAA